MTSLFSNNRNRQTNNTAQKISFKVPAQIVNNSSDHSLDSYLKYTFYTKFSLHYQDLLFKNYCLTLWFGNVASAASVVGRACTRVLLSIARD